MIPKTIHYCWFGGNPLPEPARQCIESWKRYCPDYKIKQWSEKNFHFQTCPYALQAYDCRKYAFVSDVVRMKVLYEEGGFYFDTDLELLRPLEKFRGHSCVLGFEDSERVGTCFIGAQPDQPFIAEALALYDNLPFIKDGKMDCTTNVERITGLLISHGLQQNGQEQHLKDISVYPADCFTVKDLKTGKIRLTENSVAIHHFEASWMSPQQKRNTRVAQFLGPALTRKIKKLLGRQL